MNVPAGLKSNKAIAPYISRSIELESINPVISYYCKIYVLEYILTNKLHTTDKDIEAYTIYMLDETESIKADQDPENEGLHRALSDKNISLGIVMEFSYKIFNSCLEELSQYDGSNKLQLIGKFRACLNFMNLLSIFYNKPDERIEWAKYTGGKAKDHLEFEKLNKEKLKVLKFRLSQLIKDEVPLKKVDDKDLEDELEKELREIESQATAGAAGQLRNDEEEKVSEVSSKKGEFSLPSAPQFIDDGEESKSEVPDTKDEFSLPSAPQFIDDEEDSKSGVPDTKDDIFLPSAPKFISEEKDLLPTAPKFIDTDEGLLPSAPKNIDENQPHLPSAPTFLEAEDEGNDDKHITDNKQGASINLPGAPHFLPEDDENDVKLPGAPSFLPDDDISHINKDSSIKVYPPTSRKPSDTPKPVVKQQPTPTPRHVSSHTTKAEDINEIIDKAELIAKVQKHAKFAISALNYEDIKTAEKELLEGLELIRNIK
ncbi:hypothetical protein CLIB1423_08S04302 [[Candida] railenensis]|uniref:DUF605-domain-containing protein n=1 Tax=[Candida] railenensis TaxID=45579 RepID=A0A9P0VYI1_9ASCO|nr:hypothetical protein CLIB1423_08S04302 [[Candida] railenensis]